MLYLQSGRVSLEDTKLAGYDLDFDLDNKIYDSFDYNEDKYYSEHTKGKTLAVNNLTLAVCMLQHNGLVLYNRRNGSHLKV